MTMFGDRAKDKYRVSSPRRVQGGEDVRSKARSAGGRFVVPVVLTVVSALVLTACSSSGHAGAVSASHKNYKVAFDQAFMGNSVQTEMRTDFLEAAQKLQRKGVISKYTDESASNDVSTQVTQVEAQVLAGYNALLIEPTSATGLNSAINAAKQAHITVVIVNDGPVTNPYPIEVNTNSENVGFLSASYLAKRLHGRGNVLDVLGVPGAPFNSQFQDGVLKAFKPYPNIKIVATPYGQWEEPETESLVAGLLPSLPAIDGVVTQGGESYGAIEALEAAHRPLPVVVGGSRGYFIHWWVEEYRQNHYNTISLEANPWISAASLYVAVDKLQGQSVPQNIYMPVTTVTTATLMDYKNLPPGGVVSTSYNAAWVRAHLLSQKK